MNGNLTHPPKTEANLYGAQLHLHPLQASARDGHVLQPHARRSHDDALDLDYQPSRGGTLLHETAHDARETQPKRHAQQDRSAQRCQPKAPRHSLAML